MRGVGGNSAALGVTQGDAIRDISGAFIGYGGTSWGTFQPAGVVARIIPNTTGAWATLEWLTFYAHRVVPTAPENRPLNQAVRYLMKAKN